MEEEKTFYDIVNGYAKKVKHKTKVIYKRYKTKKRIKHSLKRSYKDISKEIDKIII